MLSIFCIYTHVPLHDTCHNWLCFRIKFIQHLCTWIHECCKTKVQVGQAYWRKMSPRSFFLLNFLLKTYEFSLSAIQLHSFFLISFIFPFIPLPFIGPNNVRDLSLTFSISAISSSVVQFWALTLCFFSSVSMIIIR